MELSSSKFQMPKQRIDYVARERLYHVLDRLWDYPLCGIFAGAGYGKTTLVMAYVTMSNRPALWFSLDETCDDAGYFYRCLFQLLSLDTSDDVYGMLEQPLDEEAYRLLLDHVCASLQGKAIVLVIDNLHQLHDALLLSTFTYFLHHIPQDMHVILIGREEHAISLYEDVLKDTILLLDPTSLSFTQEEAMEVLHQTFKGEESEETLLQLCQKADGWIAGLQLLTMANKDHSSTFSKQLLHDYMSKEIMASLTCDQQEFLIQTSILHSFDRALCRHMLPFLDVESIIAFLLNRNFMLVLSEEDIFTYHDILKDYLVSCFKKQSKETKENMRKMAANLYRQRGDLQECLYHLLQIPDYSSAMQLLASTSSKGDIQQYFKKIPREVICENPDFAYQYYFYYYVNYEEEECRLIYQLIKDHLQGEESFHAFENSFAIVEGPSKQLYTMLSLEQLHHLAINKETLSFMLVKDAYLLCLHNQYEACRKRLKEAEKLYQQMNNPYVGSMLYMQYAQLYEVFGDFQQALYCYQKMEQFIERYHQNHQSYEIGLAGIYIKQMRLEEADELLTRCENRAKTNSENLMMAGIHTRMQYDCAKQNYDLAMELLQTLNQSSNYHDIRYQFAVLKQLYVAYPSLPVFARIAEQDEREGYKELSQADGCLCCAQMEIAEKNYQKAYSRIEHLQFLARKQQSWYVLIEANVLKLQLLWKMKQQDQRMEKDLFMEAFTLACPQQIRLPFLPLQHQFSSTLCKALQEVMPHMSEEETAFLDSLKLPIKQEELLTPREWEVLALIALGKSNKAIAESLYISIATVKSHIISIYGKLSCSTRVEASNYYAAHEKKKAYF